MKANEIGNSKYSDLLRRAKEVGNERLFIDYNNGKSIVEIVKEIDMQEYLEKHILECNQPEITDIELLTKVSLLRRKVLHGILKISS